MRLFVLSPTYERARRYRDSHLYARGPSRVIVFTPGWDTLRGYTFRRGDEIFILEGTTRLPEYYEILHRLMLYGATEAMIHFPDGRPLPDLSDLDAVDAWLRTP